MGSSRWRGSIASLPGKTSSYSCKRYPNAPYERLWAM
jgi:Bacterial regulatory helix-turn-helix proteins, AraC family